MAGIERFVGLATPAVADPRDRPTLRGKIIPLLPRLLFPNALAELVDMTDAIRNSDLDWTIARITSPNNRPAKGTTRAGFLGRDKVGFAMSRADIAAFLVGQLTDNTYHHAAPPPATEPRNPPCSSHSSSPASSSPRCAPPRPP